MAESTEGSEKTPENTEESNKETGKSDEVFKNFQSEVGRKFKNNEQKLDQINLSLTQLLQNQQVKPKEPQQTPTELSELMYTDPEKAIDIIGQRVAEKVGKENKSIRNQQTEMNTMINQLAMDYPEITDSNSEVYKKALELAAKDIAGQNREATPLEAEIAIRRAIGEFGLIPVSQRKSEERDEYMGSGNKGTKKTRTKSDDIELDQATIDFANLIAPTTGGRINTNDPKYIQKLKDIKKSREENGGWRKYQ